MRKLFFLSLFYLPLALYAQPKMTYESHGLHPGTVNAMQQTQYIAPGNGGAQVVWDYSALLPTGPAETSEALSAMNTDRTMVSNAAGGRFSYNCNSQGNVFESYQDETQTVVYEQPITKVSYPFTYGDKLSGIFSARTTYPNASIEHRMAGAYSSEADAFGTLIMPGGQELNNVLRLKTVEKYIEERCERSEVEMVKYLWYIQEHRYPVFVTWDINYRYADGRTVVNQASFYTASDLQQDNDTPEVDPSFTAALASGNEDNAILYTVSPNPYSDYFYLSYSLEQPVNVNITLYSLYGTPIATLVNNQIQQGLQYITYSPRNNEISGIYYLRLQFGDKVYVKALIKD